jgi:hypothetical protein
MSIVVFVIDVTPFTYLNVYAYMCFASYAGVREELNTKMALLPL